MKTLKLFVLAIAVITLSACSSDDDSSTPVVELTNANLAGTYEIVSLEGSEVERDGSTGVVVKTEEFTTDTFTNATFTFTEGGTFFNAGSYRIITTTTVTGESPVTEMEIVTFDDDEYTYSTSNVNRTITIDGDVVVVTSFDGTNLYLAYSDVEEDEGNTYTFNSQTRLRKLN